MPPDHSVNIHVEERTIMSLQFNTAYYLTENPDVAAALDAGLIESAKWHFDNFGASEGRNPNATFNTAYYLEANPDVAEAFEAGIINPFDHFLQYGASENRAPNAVLEVVAANFDEADYLAANEDVAAAVESGVFASGYQHWVMYGQFEETRDEATYNGGTPVSSATDTSALTEALGELKTAQDALSSFLESAADNEAVAAKITAAGDEPTTAEIDDALDEALTTTTAAVATALDEDPADFAAAGANTKAGLIADGREADQVAIDSAQEDVDDYQAEIAKVSGLNAAISAKSAAAARVVEATSAQAAANAELNGRLVTFAESNSSISDDADIAYLDADEAPLTAPIDYSAVASITVGGTEIFTVEDGVLTSVAADDIEGVAALQAAVEAKLGAEAELAAANAANDAADTRLNGITDLTDGDFDTEGDGTAVYNELTSRESDLEDAQEALQDLDDAVAAWEGVVALDSERTELETAIKEAEQAIEGEDGLGVNLLVEDDGVDSGAGTVGFTDNDDVYLFNAENADEGTITVSGFGNSGQDHIFFGDEYTLVELDEAWDNAADTGDASVLEIFWTQDASGLTLYVEDKAFGGNASGVDDITQINLAGVTDFDFANGYLTAGEPA